MSTSKVIELLQQALSLLTGRDEVPPDDRSLSPEGVWKPSWLTEMGEALRRMFPDGYLGEGHARLRVDFPWRGIIWDRTKELCNATPEQRASIDGNFHTGPNYAIFAASYGTLQYAPNADHITIRKVGETTLPDGSVIPRYEWVTLKHLPDVWTIKPGVYQTEQELKNAFCRWCRETYKYDPCDDGDTPI
ncbi:MAG: hypothetical protein NZ518_00005 [Dehalococcoidia bacterium]|nr:hypothetical protein [Dehalococcoidia bacterium]